MIDTLGAARKRLRALAATSSPSGDILSVALTTSRLDDWRQTVPTYVNSEFNRLTRERAFAREDRRRLQSAYDRVVDLLEYEVSENTEGIVVFSDGTAEVDEQVEVNLRLNNYMAIEPWPYLRPVVNALSLLEPFVLARVSQDESNLYLVDEWGVTMEDDISGPWLRTSDRETGELSIKKYYAAARRDGLVEQHYKEVASNLAKLLESAGVRRVVLSAQHDIAVAFSRTLPSSASGAIVSEIPWEATASVAKAVAAARKAADQAKALRIDALAARINEGLGPGGHGVAGLDQVSGVAARGQLHTLLIDRQFRVPGLRCEACPWTGLTAVQVCPLCSGRTVPTADAAGELVRLAILGDSTIEVAEGVASLDALGGIAGLLRYA